VVVAAILVLSGSIACGRKGPPLPPLLKLPVAPTELVAQRHGSSVDISFVVPSANTDGTRPANIQRVDLYGITGPETITDEELIKLGTKISSVTVKAPLDPNHTVEPDEAEDVELRSEGLDQGGRTHIVEQLTSETQKPVDVEAAHAARAKTTPPTEETPRPLPPGPLTVPSRLYAAVPISTRGKNGPSSPRVRIAMVPEPPAPDAPHVTYDEKTVTVEWPPLPMPGQAETVTDGDVLPSRPLGLVVPRVAYNVYEVSAATPKTLTRLTGEPVTLPRFSDPRVVWGETRCYTVRAFVTVEQVSLESNESPPACATFADTFPPAAPAGVQAVPSDGTITLIWDANAEKDIGGYLVFRAPADSEKLEQVTPNPIPDTSYQDKVPSGTRYAYAVKAIDAAGNISAMSARVEETAR
jgi:hypothetical protein